MTRQIRFFLLPLLLVFLTLLTTLPVTAGRGFSPDGNTDWFERICRDGLEYSFHPEPNPTGYDGKTFGPSMLRRYDDSVGILDSGGFITNFGDLPLVKLSGKPQSVVKVTVKDPDGTERDEYRTPLTFYRFEQEMPVGALMIMPFFEIAYPVDEWLKVEDCRIQSYEFLYQGFLTAENSPVNKLHDFRLTLYRSENGEAGDYDKVGETLEKKNIAVEQGAFSIPLDFGDVFDGSTYWLEIEVRPVNSGEYTKLIPRQMVNPSPDVASLAFAGEQYNSVSIVGDEDTGISIWQSYVGVSIYAPETGVSIYEAETGVSIGSATTALNIDNSEYGIVVNTDQTGILSESMNRNGIKGISYSAVNSNGAPVYGGWFVNKGGGVGLYARGDASINDSADLVLGGDEDSAYGDNGIISSDPKYPSSDLYLRANDSVFVEGDVFTDGNMTVGGTLTKSGGAFKIDHPLDPANKYLYHSFVESPDMMNIYNGNIVLDANGEAWVEMPAWFDALNIEYRYQLTPIGAPGPNLYIADEMSGNRFRIAGGAPDMSVSWQITGIRNDAYAQMNRIPVEQEKPPELRGTFVYPQGFNADEQASELLREER